jgi:hypothetical protein
MAQPITRRVTAGPGPIDLQAPTADFEARHWRA